MISNDDLVENVYRALLDRSADPDGHESFLGHLAEGTPLETLIRNILSSAEFRELRQRQANESFDALRDNLATGLYRALLLRDPDEEGRITFLDRLGDGEELEVLIRNMLASEEFRVLRERQADETRDALRDNLASGLYRALLLREPDEEGRATFLARLGVGQELEILIQNILSSEEFRNLRERQADESRDALRDNLASALYRGILLRDPDEAGRQIFLSSLGDGEQLEPLIRNMLASPEYLDRLAKEHNLDPDRHNAYLADALYQALLGRDPDDAGRDSLIGTLRMGKGLTEVIAGIIRSDEYQRAAHAGCLRFDQFKPVCTLLDERLKLWIDMHDAHVSLGCLLDNYEPTETAFVLRHLKAGDTFVDIGANVGWFTIHAADKVGPTGKVHSFEPRTQTHGLLTRSVADNGFEDRCTVHKVALAASEAESRLVWMPDTENPGGSRLVRDKTEMVDDMEGEPVRMVTLDSVAIEGPVPIVKLDVEGAEAMVLKGASAFLAKHRPVILTEVFGQALRHVSKLDVPDFVALIRSLDYDIHTLKGGKVGPAVRNIASLETPGPISCVLKPKAPAQSVA